MHNCLTTTSAGSIKRTMDAAFLNHVANHPEVRPWLGGEGPVDLSGFLRDPANVAIETEGGGWWFLRHPDAVTYEVHSLFLPGFLGSKMIRAARETLRWMFARTNCMEIISKVPDENKASKGFQVIMGFAQRFRLEHPPHGVGAGGMTFVGLTLDEWRARDPEIVKLGRWWHDSLERAKREAGVEEPPHPDDEAHDRAVGAAVAMVRGGNPHKAVATYNRWAVFAGYAPILLISANPVVIDARDAIVSLGDDGELEVLAICRHGPQLE